MGGDVQVSVVISFSLLFDYKEGCAEEYDGSANLDSDHPKSLKALRAELDRLEKGRMKDKDDARKAKEIMDGSTTTKEKSGLVAEGEVSLARTC